LPRAATRAIASIFLVATFLLAARCPIPGQTHFVSAEGGLAFRSFDVPVLFATNATLALPPEAVSARRDVLEGDIFRVLAPGLLLNLNPFRGLQVIDVSDTEQPKILGRLAVSGTPVELHVVDSVAYLILNAARGLDLYHPTSSETRSLILAVDVSDPSHPALIAAETTPGNVLTSRVTRDGDQAALYVVSNASSSLELTTSFFTHVRSFDVSSGGLALADELDLEGVVTAVQATPDVLMVARQSDVFDSTTIGGSRLALIDIRNPVGVLVRGDDVAVAGEVRNPFNMDYHQGILRVVSGSRWSDPSNHIETFEASDVADVVPVDAVRFGENESLFATLFLGERAFAVTYRLIDPFHAFAISDAGEITVGAEFLVSGWNDFFRPVFDDTRLLGVGTDDGTGRTLSVSLYDVTEIANPDPLLARESVGAESSSSEASFDHRAFSVLEDAVSALGPGGAIETGLVLLPFTSFGAGDEFVADVQLFTFSDHTLTRRGSMAHGSPVRRSFATGEAVVASLSEQELSLFETADPDQPVELGRVELAPDYTDVFRFGDHRVRIVNGTRNGIRPWGWGTRTVRAEVVPAALDPDLAEPVAGFAVTEGAAFHRTGSYLVAVVFDPDATGSAESEITAFDLSDPLHPVQTAKIRTSRLVPPDFSPIRAISMRVPLLGMPLGAFAPICLACTSVFAVAAIPDGLAFLQSNGGGSASLDVLDLRSPDAPAFAPSIALDAGLAAVGLVAGGSDVWVSSQRHLRTDLRGRSSARFYAQRFDVSDPSAPLADALISVPGELVAVEGSRIFTRDLQWEGLGVEPGVVRLALEEGLARVEAVRWFPGQRVTKVELDGADHVLVSHTPQSVGFLTPVFPSLRFASTGLVSDAFETPELSLSVLDADSADLELLSETTVEAFASALGSIPGRALFQVPGGVLVLNLDDPSAPLRQAFFATPTPVDRIALDGRAALAAEGRFGIQLFDLDTANSP